MSDTEDAVAALTRPGALFEIAEEDVLGFRMPVFVHQERSLIELLRRSERFGDSPYLLGEGFRIGFAENARRARRGAALLRERHGVRPGDRVAIYGLNGPEWIVAFWSAVAAGAIVVCGNSMGVGPELRHQLELTGPVVAIADAQLRRRLSECGSGSVAVEAMETFFAHTGEEGRDEPWPDVSVLPDDPATVVFTSGTTGVPKGATHSHRNMVAASWFHRHNDAVATVRGRPPGTRRYLLVAPLFHISSLHNIAVVRLTTGDAVVIHRGKFDIDAVLDLIERHGVTNWGAMPTMLARLVRADLEGRELSTLRSVTVNSAPSSPELREEVRRRLPHVVSAFGTSYGLTETSTAVTMATAEMLREEEATVGVPIPTMRVEVRGPDGSVLPDGAEGEIFVYGPLVMLGYWGAGVRAGIGADGWLATGDLGYLREGRLQLSSRRSDLIIRGGQNVYPAEVENALMTHPVVRECAVLGLPDEEWGQLVAAVVVAEPSDAVDARELERHLSTRLARYKIPVRWQITAAPLPRNATGKVVRRELPTASLAGSGA